MQKTNKTNLIAACSAITVFGFAFGMTFPLLSLTLEARGVSTDLIGLNSAMMPIGILLFSSIIPFLTRRFGAKNLAICAGIISAGVILSYRVFDTLSAWFVIRLIHGMSISTLFVLSESWVIGSATEKNRGKIVAIYGSMLSGSFGAGPLIISYIGIDGWLPYVIGAVVIALGTIPFLFIKQEKVEAESDKSTGGIFSFAPKAPALLAAVGAFAIFDAATLSLLPIYGIQNGLDLTTSANLLTALILGNVLLQLPIGWLADRYSHRYILICCAIVTCASLFLLPQVIDNDLKWPLLVLMGTTGYGLYTVSLASLGKRFQGIDLINGTASFAVMWGTGALLGTISGGWGMKSLGVHSLPVGLAIMFIFLAVLLWQRKNRD